MSNPVVLITGGAQRIGADVVTYLHAHNFNIVLHYYHSEPEAKKISSALNIARENSAIAVKADLGNMKEIDMLAKTALQHWCRLDVLINNASSFYPTPIGNTEEQDWDNIFSSNVKAPFFLAQILAPELKKQSGCIINIADIYADRPLKNHSLYCIAKAGNTMLTKCLAQELAPEVRTNGIAPGAILWPETADPIALERQKIILSRIPLQRTGTTTDIAKTVLFLINDAPYINGQIITVDGGRTTTV